MRALKKKMGKNQKIPMQQIHCKKIKTMKEKKSDFWYIVLLFQQKTSKFSKTNMKG